MSDVKAVTIAADASAPTHPDHDRWVKEQTLATEIEHAARTGGSLRTAEDTNIAALNRLAQRKATPRKPAKQTKRKTFAHREISKKELQDAGVTKKVATKPTIAKPPVISPDDQKWAFRVARIMELGRQGDKRAYQLALEVVAIKMAVSARRDYKDANGRELPFSRLRGASVHRAVRAGMEWVCDRSRTLLGEWR